VLSRLSHATLVVCYAVNDVVMCSVNDSSMYRAIVRVGMFICEVALTMSWADRCSPLLLLLLLQAGREFYVPPLQEEL
jgi:hypothetical protein